MTATITPQKIDVPIGKKGGRKSVKVAAEISVTIPNPMRSSLGIGLSCNRTLTPIVEDRIIEMVRAAILKKFEEEKWVLPTDGVSVEARVILPFLWDEHREFVLLLPKLVANMASTALEIALTKHRNKKERAGNQDPK